MGRRRGKAGHRGDGTSGSAAARGPAAAARGSKVCPACGLPFENRKKWASRGLWESIVYCSERCRRRGR